MIGLASLTETFSFGFQHGNNAYGLSERFKLPSLDSGLQGFGVGTVERVVGLGGLERGFREVARTDDRLAVKVHRGELAPTFLHHRLEEGVIVVAF
jgi:hypothetical protein